MKQQLILASTSPRRRELFKVLHIPFLAVDSGYEEIVDPKMKPEQLVKFLAMGKAQAAAKKYPRAIIVAADTMVVFGGKAIGKPKTKLEAEKMLKSFSGKSQDVITGVAILDAVTKQVHNSAINTKVYFRKLSSNEIAAYVKTGEPFDKAGGYGPMGPGFNLIDKIEGDFTNVFGLPMGVVFNKLEKLGFKCSLPIYRP